MNGTHIMQAITGELILELIIDSQNITKAGFTPRTTFKIKPYRDGLIITLATDEAEIKRLLLEVDADPNISVDWIRDNGELYLEGEWLTQSELTRQPLAISVMPGQVVIQVQQGNMLT